MSTAMSKVIVGDLGCRQSPEEAEYGGRHNDGHCAAHGVHDGADKGGQDKLGQEYHAADQGDVRAESADVGDLLFLSGIHCELE